MRKRKKHKQKFTPKMPISIFTQETLRLAQKALVPFEEWLNARSPEEENIQFARETLASVKHKLATLTLSSGSTTLVVFDQNEGVILAYSFQLYLLELAITEEPDTPEKAKEMLQCRQLHTHFLSHLS